MVKKPQSLNMTLIMLDRGSSILLRIKTSLEKQCLSVFVCNLNFHSCLPLYLQIDVMCKTAHRRSQRRAFSIGLVDHSLALEQHVGLSEQGHLWSQAPLAVGQVADVTPQLLLTLSAHLQLTFQPPQLLLQPER